jgi:hypothetical protein
MATVETGEGRVLLRNSYGPSGRVFEQVFADGSRYGYSYSVNRENVVTQTVVTAPDGEKLAFNFRDGELIR